MGANTSTSPYPERASSSHIRPGSSLGRQPNLLLPGSESDAVLGNREGQSSKKKRMHKFATFRKKFIRARRHSRSLDYAKVMRELTSNWTVKELHALVEEYESSAALKDLLLAASLARQHANSIREDLSALYDYKYCTDVDLVYQGVVFPVHRAILSVRCPRLRELLLRYPDYGMSIPVHIRTPGVDTNMFSSLLRSLYTGEFSTEEYKNNMDILVRLAEEFGPVDTLEHDMRTLLETGIHCDAVLNFSGDFSVPPLDSASASGSTGHPESGGMHSATAKNPHHKHELRCHKAILAARSPFFRNLLLRRARSGEEMTERALHSPSCIILDDSVIPRRYARVILNALYTDTVDLTCIIRSSISMCSLSEVQAMVNGKGHVTLTDEAMEIFQIGQFLDLPVLSQGCEDLIAESIGLDNLLSILAWSQEPHGSQWVYRQALHFLKEEFLQIAHSPILCELNRSYMIHAFQSDFLQAGELDVLCAMLKWGEHQLMKRMEEREPNLLSHTAHSVSKKGIKKRDLNDVELRDILTELLPFVRTDHIIPANHEALTSAIKRGLISRPPSHMLADEGTHSVANAWVRIRNTGMFIKPRLFTPYYEEAKSLLDEQLNQVQENEVVRLRMIQMSNIPDMVQYMVEERGYPGHRHIVSLQPPPTSTATSVDVIAGTIPMPNPDMLGDMLKRETELYQSKLVERARALPYTNGRLVSHYVQLRVVREFGLPDSMVEVLHPSQAGGPSEEELLSEARYHTPRRERHKVHMVTSISKGHHHLHHHHHHHHFTMPCHHQVFRRVASQPHGQHASSPCAHRCGHSSHHPIYHTDDRCPSTPSTLRSLSAPEKDSGSCSDSVLSETMPDIALATSAMNQLSLQNHDADLAQPPPDLELDLGDGSNHSHSNNGTLYI